MHTVAILLSCQLWNNCDNTAVIKRKFLEESECDKMLLIK